jgi:hypothetical protein
MYKNSRVRSRMICKTHEEYMRIESWRIGIWLSSLIEREVGN